MYTKNQNWIAVVVGQVGTGKTYFALELSDEMMDKTFNPNLHLIFSIEEFMLKLNSNQFKKGDVLVFEEAGVNISSKDWQSKANKNINFVLQTCRHRNFSIIFTLPIYKFLDSSTRALIHTAFVTKRIDYTRNVSFCRVYNLKTNALKDSEPQPRLPKFWINNVLVSMKTLACKLPSDEIVTIYEDRKKEFTDKLNKQIEKEITFENTEKEKKQNKPRACDICGLSSWSDFSKKDKSWECRKCGFKTSINPYLNNQNNI